MSSGAHKSWSSGAIGFRGLYDVVLGIGNRARPVYKLEVVDSVDIAW